MKRIALLKSNLAFQGGLEKYTIMLAQRYHERGDQVTILTTGKVPEKYPFDVISLKCTYKISFAHHKSFDRACRHWLKRHLMDVIFGMERNSFQTHYRAGSGVHSAYLQQRARIESPLKRFSFFINPLHRTIKKLEKKAFCHPQLKMLFTNSEMVKREILERYPVDPKKILVVHNGINWEGYAKPFGQRSYNPGRFQFLFVGNDYRRKGLPFLLDALEKLEGNFHLTVVGKDKNLEYYKKRAPSYVTYVGQKSDLIPFYQKADALVVPSIYDPFANVTLEALAMGLYVVSSDTNGSHEILTPDCGCVAPIDDLLPALQKALAHPKTPESSLAIRQKIKRLDLATQLDCMIQNTHD
ncbi:MAG: glycosyltransferase family 4 protein [Chlamydiales bacterium]